MPSGTSSSTSESPEVLRQPIPGIIIPAKPNIDLPIVNPLVSVTLIIFLIIFFGLEFYLSINDNQFVLNFLVVCFIVQHFLQLNIFAVPYFELNAVRYMNTYTYTL
jgi:hypothetical protein